MTDNGASTTVRTATQEESAVPLHQLTPQQYEASSDIFIEPVPLFDQRCMVIRDCGPNKGKGVFASTSIPARTVIDVSPTLIFPADEYNVHGQYTQLDHYTYRWQGGSMALALGLGSMFNHSSKPNVGYQRLFDQRCIRYSTLRDIQPGEELFISYGNVWFPEVDDHESQKQGEQEPYKPSSDISDSEDETGDVFLSKVAWPSDDEE